MIVSDICLVLARVFQGRKRIDLGFKRMISAEVIENAWYHERIGVGIIRG